MGNLIICTGSYVPERVVTNQDLLAYVDPSGYDQQRSGHYPEWANLVMGFDQRHHWTAPDHATSDLAFEAAGCTLAFDLSSAYLGFVYGLHVAEAMLAHYRQYRYALVVGADKATSFTGFRHYIAGAIFGYGAKSHWAWVPAGGAATPITCDNCQEIYQTGWHCFKLQAQDIKNFAVAKVEEATRRALAMRGLGLGDITYVLPYKAGRRILEDVGSSLNLPSHKVLSNYRCYGNTSQASIFILLDENRRFFKQGNYLVLAALSGGFGWGAVLYRWRELAQVRRQMARQAQPQAGES